VKAEAAGSLAVENPSTGEKIAEAPLSTKAQAGKAVEAAAAAFRSWSATPVARRCAHLFKLVELLTRNEEKLARSIAEEMGKSLPDARAEIKRAVENCEVACGMPVLQQGDKLIGCSTGIDGQVLRLPMGVFAVAAPFNFPLMVPFWFMPYAIATGNTYVVKPSEQVPCTMQLATQLIDEIGLPPGVFNLVNGDKTVVEAFLEHPLVQGISFVGTTRVCRIIAERCAGSGKRFQAFGSAKNHLVVMPDAKIAQVIQNMITSCYGCAGQRCMASSAIVCVGEETYRAVTERFVVASRKVIVADPLDRKVANEPVVMGPVISAAAKKRILSLIEEGVREGAHLALDGRGLVVKGRENGHFVGPTVFTDVKPGMKVHLTEIFGPVVVILKADSLDEAIRIVNSSEYGNGGSIYTQNGHYARKFTLEAQVGMVGVNVGIPAPVAYLPFGGMKASFFGDTKTQGKEIIHFFTQSKVVTERYWEEA
jgi:malonate-semialdehyde dehydrogenase (acetylating)/methylmalonate-semialdehyde dehydrogenase